MSMLPDGCLVAIVRDVTARVEADVARLETQRALSLSEERHRLLARVTREIIWDGRTDVGTSTLTGAIGDVFGFENDTVEVDKNWWRARIHPDDVNGVFASAIAALKSLSGDQWIHEYRLQDQAGRYLNVLARGLIIRNETGYATRFVGSLVDITQRRRDEEELRLAHRAAERATEAKSLFLANMSHEIRTPLTTVIAGTELVLDSALDPAQEQTMVRVHRAGERLLKLVDDLLDFSRIEAGQIRVDNLAFDPAVVVTQTAAWAHDVCQEKRIEFRLTMPDSVSQLVLGDPHRLSQVLTNLISNAVKFTSAGHVHLSVIPVREDARARTLSFAVEDTGTGISSEHQSHIFQSFSQADPSITRRFGGSGLGLAISKNIVEFMGGTIGVESRPGEGSRFFFEVPFAVPVERVGSARSS
jgi:signal transduction histidine kinase